MTMIMANAYIKSEITIIKYSKENSNWKVSSFNCQNQKLKLIKRIEKKCHIPALLSLFIIYKMD